MKKVLVSVALGFALLAPGQPARCEERRPSAPRPRTRVERPSPIDFARSFALRLFEASKVPQGLLAEPAPPPVPQPEPDDDSNEVCTPERVHCPIG